MRIESFDLRTWGGVCRMRAGSEGWGFCDVQNHDTSRGVEQGVWVWGEKVWICTTGGKEGFARG